MEGKFKALGFAETNYAGACALMKIGSGAKKHCQNTKAGPLYARGFLWDRINVVKRFVIFLGRNCNPPQPPPLLFLIWLLLLFSRGGGGCCFIQEIGDYFRVFFGVAMWRFVFSFEGLPEGLSWICARFCGCASSYSVGAILVANYGCFRAVLGWKWAAHCLFIYLFFFSGDGGGVCFLFVVVYLFFWGLRRAYRDIFSLWLWIPLRSSIPACGVRILQVFG